MKKIEVVAAIIINRGQILCMQRGLGRYDYISYKYEFPGGKIEKNEDHMAALKRELAEEMQMDISQNDLEYFMTVEHQYPDFHLTMHSYTCVIHDRVFALTEHIDFKWSDVKDLADLDWAAADLPIVEKIMVEMEQ